MEIACKNYLKKTIIILKEKIIYGIFKSRRI